MKKIDIEVRPMNGCVATCAIAPRLETEPAVWHVGRRWIYMTLKAQETFLSAHHQIAIHASVWGMAGGTTLHLHRRVFKYEGPALFRVTLRAGFPAASDADFPTRNRW